jgi:hypothetical protein
MTNYPTSLDAEVGSFDILGQDASFLRTRIFNAEVASEGEYQAADYVDPTYVQGIGYHIDGQTYHSGDYVNPGYISGTGATLAYHRVFPVDPGIFVLTGQNVTFEKIGLPTPTEIAEALIAAMMAQATNANIVEVNQILVTGAGTPQNPWGPTTGSYGYVYTPPANVQDIVTAFLTQLNSTDVPINVSKVNTVAVTGLGTTAVPWGPV